MKQIQFTQFGSPSQVAQCVDVPDVGAPSAWEVVVDVEAFPINPADLAMLAGRYGKLPKLPATIGMEAVGRIRAKGKEVVDLDLGDRVVILANNNWAERRKVPAAAVHKVPHEGAAAKFATLKVNPATALLLLTRIVSLNEHEWVLQTAPLSTVGRCVMQIAKARKIRTVNVIRRSDARAEVIEIGGDVAIENGPDLSQRVRVATGGRPIRLALDAVAGPGVQQLAECLGESGQLINYGMLSGEPCVIGPEQTIFRGITLRGFWLSNVLNGLTLPERTTLFSSLCGMVADGQLCLPIDSQFPLQNVGEALRRAEQSVGRRGKVIVTIT